MAFLYGSFQKWGADFITAALSGELITQIDCIQQLGRSESDVLHSANWVFGNKSRFTTHLGIPIFEIHIFGVRTCADWIHNLVRIRIHHGPCRLQERRPHSLEEGNCIKRRLSTSSSAAEPSTANLLTNRAPDSYDEYYHEHNRTGRRAWWCGLCCCVMVCAIRQIIVPLIV